MNKKKVFIDTLGCPKNFNDSEYAAGVLEGGGFEMAGTPEDADFVIVNTCGFIDDAKRESIEHIFAMNESKKDSAKLIISGCLSQRYAEQLEGEIPEADGIIGVNEYDRLPEILTDLDERKLWVSGCTNDKLEKTVRKFEDNPYTATLKIAEGCNNTCTYCIIPKIRGRYRSKSIEDIISEAKELAAAGCKELILIAQDVTYYGLDLYKKQMLPELLRELCKIEDIRWIRLMYCYDERITDELIETIANEEKICKYIDIPLQHASDSVLKRMKRHTTSEGIKNTIRKLRKSVPDICIRTTLIVGFPGETEEEYGALCEMVETEKFDRLGVFSYSCEEGTEAAEMAEQIDENIKQERLDGIMMRQMGISAEHNRNMIGKVVETIVDNEEDDGSYSGRTRYDAPEIDNGVIFISEQKLKKGDIVNVLIEDAFDYDLTGRAV